MDLRPNACELGVKSQMMNNSTVVYWSTRVLLVQWFGSQSITNLAWGKELNIASSFCLNFL
jgi:predicted RecA/RadA family phage recombinase